MKQFKWLMWIALLAIASSSMAGRAVKRDPPGTDRPSGDFQRTVLPQPDAELCVNQCAADLRCAAYSYVKPNVQGKDPLCYLKGAPAPRPVKNGCCTSGTMHYVPDKPLPKTARIQPAPSTDQQFCTATSLLCYGHRGKWNTDTNSCDCTQPIDLTKPEPDPDGDKGPMRSFPGPKFEPRTPPKPQQ